uniref:Putative tick transposon n=1 Tax=Ixodes scapularis TaxID=6945 RepID=A0A4D5RGK0_IXOSC
MSLLLSAFYLEPFCLSVIQCEQVHGFRMDSVEKKALSYADDVAVFYSNKRSVEEVLKLTRSFCATTAAVVNLDPYSGVWHGTWAATPALYEGIRWECTPCKYLEIPLQRPRKTKPYWENVVEDTKKRAALWCNRDLSIFTRATV